MAAMIAVIVVITVSPALATVALIVIAMTVLAVLSLLLWFGARCLEQLPPAHRVVHNRFVCCLLLLLDCQHGILPNLRCRVSYRVRILQSHERLLIGALIQLLALVVLEQGVDATFAQ